MNSSVRNLGGLFITLELLNDLMVVAFHMKIGSVGLLLLKGLSLSLPASGGDRFLQWGSIWYISRTKEEKAHASKKILTSVQLALRLQLSQATIHSTSIVV